MAPSPADPRARPTILVTNDDGYDAPGLRALVDALAGLGRIVVVAPDRECSGASHALTLARPLRLHRVAEDRYRVDGTPTDCVHLGVFRLARDTRPALVASGINRGLNVGDDVTYSGTVAGALEGALLHVPSMAVSTDVPATGEPDWTAAAAFSRRLAETLLQRDLAPGTFLNVNVPQGRPAGVRIVRQGSRSYRASMLERRDPSGRPYYWIAGAETTPTGESDGDHAAVEQGFIAVSPLHADMTHVPSLDVLESWGLDRPEPAGRDDS